jgi:hypothetical protein
MDTSVTGFLVLPVIQRSRPFKKQGQATFRDTFHHFRTIVEADDIAHYQSLAIISRPCNLTPTIKKVVFGPGLDGQLLHASSLKESQSR